MMNLHAATYLAKNLGLDLVDIYGIRKWIQMRASPLNDPDIVAEIVRNLPAKEFGKHLKINRLWYNCCKAELWKRYEKAEEAYDRAVEKKEKAGDALGQSFEEEGIGNRELHELNWKEYQKAYKELTDARKEQIMKKKAYNGSIYFEFAADLKGISTKHKVSIRSDAGEDDGMTTSIKLKDLLIQASVTKICYTDVNFMPYPPNAPKYNPEFFNLFLGFRAQPAEHIKLNLVNPIIRHVHEVWCAEDKQLTTYILNWLAFLVQNPDKKPGTAIIMRSPPRCGKNILTDFIGERILGRENFLSTTRLEDVMGRFNAAVRAKKLIILNECDMTGKEWHGANN
ncbi:uncharacterized protein OCT59_000960 [Rhizophagus irregularis]|uniref:uncharacterized protein n=1 Tax=Rhizophagus irregularis TaxID=588596 RepID=UPI0033175D25|nr:hypothetical protein OCT59_000960 [Rhizophagus irregularis]